MVSCRRFARARFSLRLRPALSWNSATCVNGKHLVHGLAHIRNEIVYIREVLVFRVVLIIIDHAHYSRGNYGTFAVGPDRLGGGIAVFRVQAGYIEIKIAVFSVSYHE